MPVSSTRMPVSILKSNSQHSKALSSPRSCSSKISSSERTDASGGGWFLQCITVDLQTSRPLTANLYSTGGHLKESRYLHNGVGVCSDTDRTQLVDRMTSHRDSKYGHLVDLEESLGKMRSRGDSIVRFILSTLGTHLSITTPYLPSIAQDRFTRESFCC